MLKESCNFPISEDDDNFYINVESAAAIVKDKKTGVQKQFVIQTLVFPKDKFKAAADAKKWAKDNDFKFSKVDETGTSFRLRQKPPGKFTRLRTIDLGDGVKAVGGPIKKSAIKQIKKSIWAIKNSRFFAMCDMFGSDNVFNELDHNPLWHGAHCFKSKNGSEDIKKFASNIDQKSAAEIENKEVWNGSRYDNLPPGEREFVTEVDNQLRKAVIIFKEHVGDIDECKEHYLQYIKNSADAIIKALAANKSFDNLIDTRTNVSHYGQYDTNGHRHGQHNGGLTGTDIPVPEVPDFHFHIMEGGRGATWSNNNDIGHLHLDPDDKETGVPIWPEYSCKEKAATTQIIKELFERKINVIKLNAPKQIVIGALYIPFDKNNPETVDTHGHACTKEEIENTAYEFMRQKNLGNVDLQHNFEKGYGYVVESYIAKDGDPDFIPGTWVVGVKITDNNVWRQVEKGEITGFSLAGEAYLREVA